MPSRLARILVLLTAVLALTASAGAGTRAVAGAPNGLHPFLLRVDEPHATSFARTPSFAWNPVSGALRYEFQLSTSNAFRENGIVYSDTSLTSPVASAALTLPWITGTPHALYARVRAVLADTTTAWSSSYGFDMEPASVPTPLPSAPGLLRWTPVDGAAGYQVWFVDLPKTIAVSTNVADEREFYTFHQAAPWLSNVRWRIRAMRNDFNGRANGLPAVSYGAWSPVYSSVNPPFAVGPLKPTMTISDVSSSGAASSPAHRLMPAFVYGGNQSLALAASEFYRVHVFTDKGCINRVYSGAIVGGPAFAPRATGPLGLPVTQLAINGARTTYLPDGNEGDSYSADFEKIVSNESLADIVPTTGLPAGTLPPAAGSTPTAPTSGSTPAPAAPAAPAGGAPSTVELIKATGTFGPPVDLWDTDWESGGGYYWTVVGVDAKVPGAASTAVDGVGAPVGGTTLPVGNTTGFAVGDTISVGSSGNSEAAAVTAVSAGSLAVAAPLKFAHGAGEPVARTSGNIQYRDAELAQDVCAAGRVLRFGKASEPALTSGGEPFASGLSPNGALLSAGTKPRFYGSPLVAWTTALGAEVYAVQWSKTKQPFKPETDPATGALGMMTLNTSVVLPLTPGTWYYRVRGYNYSLPTNAQAMSWSDPQALVVTKPTFEVVSGGSRSVGARKLAGSGFSVQVPTSWSSARTSAKAGPRLSALGTASSALRLAAHGPDAALFVQSAPDGSSTQTAWSRKTIARMKALPSRTSAPVSCSNVSLPAGAGVRCSLSTRVAGGKQAAVVYLLRHRNATYTLTFASAVGPGKSATFAAAARSFRFSS